MTEDRGDEIYSELSLQVVHERAHPCLTGITDPLPGGILMAFLWAAGNIVENLKSEQRNDGKSD